MSMSFQEFAAAHGLVLRNFIDDGKIRRCPTESHPRGTNGSYRCTGDWGWIQDWAVHETPQLWFADNANEVVRRAARRDMADVARQEAQRRAAAAEKARGIVLGCHLDVHPYLERKGFAKEQGLIDFDGRLVVPMRDVSNYARIQSLQWIAGDGEKKFMPGGAAKGAVMMLGSGTESWLCEGFATALSVRAALKYLHRSQARVVICFSAGNLTHVAGHLPGARFIVADNDASGTGKRAAEATGLPWVMPPIIGHDANDMHLASGVPALAALLRTLVQPHRGGLPTM